MNEALEAFIKGHPDAAMVTTRRDGTAHLARIEVAVVDGKLWSSGAPNLVRTRNLRRDPRCSVFVFGPHPQWAGLDTVVTILDGSDAADLHIRLMRVRHGDAVPEGMVMGHDDVLGHDRLYSESEYLDHVRAEERLIYEFSLRRRYGYY